MSQKIFRQRFSFIASIIFVVIFTLTFSLVSVFRPVDHKNSQQVEFEILPGQSLNQIATNLENHKLVRSALALELYLYSHNYHRRIQAGFFYLSPSQSTIEIGKSLTKAVTKQVRVVIPEGLRRQEIANLILDALEKAQINHNFNPEEFITKTATLEGKLFPDTYNLSAETSTEGMITKLTQQFSKVYTKLDLPVERQDQIITLASLIEREAGGDQEKPEIAGVITNRLDYQWPLQVDATVQFALANVSCRLRICDWWPQPLTKIDLNFNSEYNTYLQPGLPPSPICNPGEKSLEAAAFPQKTPNWFYLHDNDGQIHFAKTVEEHNKNVCLYLKKDC